MEARRVCLSVLVLASLLLSVLGYPSTVPPTPSVCRSMTPGHGPRPLTSAPICQVQALGDTVKNGGQLEVVVSATDNTKTFKGYYLQARDSTNNPIGTFSPTTEVKVHSCGGIKANAAHHSSKAGKKSVSVFWKAPAKYEGAVTFTVTCVKDFENFWTFVKSQPVKVLP